MEKLTKDTVVEKLQFKYLHLIGDQLCINVNKTQVLNRKY